MRIILFLSISITFFYSCSLLDDNDHDDEKYSVIDTVEIYMIDIDGSNNIKIADGSNPTYAADLNKIFYRYYDDIYSIDLDGTNKKLIAKTLGHDVHNYYYEIAITPDNRYLFFYSELNNFYDIFRVDIAGSNLINITNTDSCSETYIRVSPSNENFVYHELFYDSKLNTQYKYGCMSKRNYDGTNYQRISCGLIGGSPKYSLNGEYILTHKAYSSYDSTWTRFYLLDANNYQIVDSCILNGIWADGEPALSNDINVYYSSREENIYKLDLITKQQTELYIGTTGVYYRFTSDFKKAIIGGYSLRVIDLENNSSKTILNNLDFNIRDFRILPDNQSVLYVKSISHEY